MSDQLSEIVGQDVNLEAEQPAPEAEQPTQGQEQPAEAAVGEQEQQPAQDTRTVPLAALHEERQKRKELAGRLERLEQERSQRDALIEQRIAALTQAREQAQMPAFEENPAEHLRAQLQQVQQTSQATAQQIQAWNQQQAQMQQIQRLSSSVAQQEAEFVQQAPDYTDALNHLRSQRVAELVADGADPSAASELAGREFMHFALTRAQAGVNPAKVVYDIAKARGYVPKSQQVASPAEKIQSQKQGVAAAKSLGSGGPASNKITAETLASMSDEEFAELTKGNNWQKIMGG